MSEVARRLSDEGLTQPPAPAPVGAYVPAVRSGSIVFTSGQLPIVEGSLLTTGAVGAEVPVESAMLCARACALNALAAAATVCDLDRVTRVLKVTGYVASAPGFFAQPAVIDGASEVLSIAFGEHGIHAREAVGVLALPRNAPVEVSIVLECG